MLLNKQDIIREGITLQMPKFCEECQLETAIECKDENLEKTCAYQSLLANNTLIFLHSQDVVRKIKCPDCVWGQFGEEAVGMTPCHSCNSMGYIIDPLIEEKVKV